jgi:hypothetical protein
MTHYPMVPRLQLVAALRATFGSERFDEYSVVARQPSLPLGFLYDRKRTTRSALHLWLRWAADQGVGL